MNVSNGSRKVFRALQGLGDATYQELSGFLGWAVNRVTWRVDELRRAGKVVEGEKRKCKVTGKRVKTWRISDGATI